MTELEELINKVVAIGKYKGCLIQKTKEGFLVCGVMCVTKEDVNLVIKNSCETISKSINK